MVPNLRENFKNDLRRNFERKSNNFTKNLYINDIEEEAIMYACSMCIELKEQAGFLPPPFITDITNQVCDVITSFFDEYGESHRMMAQLSVQQSLKQNNIKTVVENYYKSY